MRTWKSLKSSRLTPPAAERVRARADAELRALTLRQLREELAFTQAALAAEADMTQSELSRLEKRVDHRVSSLRRYVAALGGEIEITAVIGGKRVKLSDV